MKIQFLGTGAADWPNPGLKVGDGRRFSSLCLNKQIIIDCGPMTLDAMDEFGVDSAALSHILIGHPHADHYNFDTIAAIAARRQASKVNTPLVLHLNAAAADKLRAQLPEGLPAGLQLAPFLPSDAFQCGELQVQALPANHHLEQADELAAHFYIESPRQESLFYALDGAWLLKEAWAFLRTRRLDLIIWELTCGDQDDWRIFDHCNLAMLKTMTRSFRKCGLLKPETQMFCSHLARTLCPDHHIFAPYLSEQGYILAWDGMCVDTGK
jgi:hypothetical protein